MSPSFSGAVTEYTATTSNATNAVTAVSAWVFSTIAITVNDAALVNGAAPTWTDGENTVTITVTNGEDETVYTVTVTKS